MWVDNVRFDGEVRGRTGDVLTADLGAIHPGEQYFALTSKASVLKTSDPTTSLALKSEVNPQRRDMRLYYETDVEGTTTQHTVGYIVFSNRVGGQPFSKTGRFYFAPGTADDLTFDSDSSSQGFQGTIVVEYAVNGVLHDVHLVVGSGYSSSGPADVSGASGPLNSMRVQQRLNYLGYADYEGKPLIIDGIIGPRTQSALRKFKAAGTNPAGDPDAQTNELDSYTVTRLNGGGDVLGAETRQSLSQGLRQAATKVKLGDLETLSMPLPIVGTTPLESQHLPDQPADEVSLASALSLNERLTDSLFTPLADYLEASESPSLADLQQFLQEQGIDGLTITGLPPCLRRPRRLSTSSSRRIR